MISENKKTLRKLDIFISSPCDVQKEREIAIQVINRLNNLPQIARRFVLKPLAYEKSVPPAIGQSLANTIDRYMLEAGKADIYICILWHRWGTPVVDDKGIKYQSGTEYEFLSAYHANQETGKPRMLLYRCMKPIPPEADPEQWQRVQDFFKRFISARADLKGLWQKYQDEDFEQILFDHLNTIIATDFDQAETENSTLPLEELLQACRGHLACRVSTVRIFGEAEPRPLEKVFVELTLTEEYERTTANAQWLGMMDAELRRRRDIFARDDEDREFGMPERERKKEKRTLKPDELLRRKTQAIIVGAPGCGKTTLLRYLSLKTLQAGKHFPVFLELKSLSEKALEAAEGNLVELLFAKAIAVPLGFSTAEAERCKAFFLARLKAGEVSIFLDGLDEVAGTKFFSALCRSINDFMASVYRHNDLIISTRPYALQHHFEDLEEMEIASLNPCQIEAFLQHYYGDDSPTRQLQQELRRRRELREMARVPFLLSVIAYLYRQQGEIVGVRLELYRQLVQQLVTQLDREKNVERFYLPDPDGSLKRDFLKQLAYERLFVDEVDKDAERLILTGEVIAAKARKFCQTHLTANHHLLAADAKATPLLREIGAETYAFAHLTLHEYLAAVALAEQLDCEKIFCHALFNPTLAEMEVLPMTLGLVRRPYDFYTTLEQLPESLTFTNLRLRVRSLVYKPNIYHKHLLNLTEWLNEFITKHKKDKYVRESAAEALGQMGTNPLVNGLVGALYSDNSFVRQKATQVVGYYNTDKQVLATLHHIAANDPAEEVRTAARKAAEKFANKLRYFAS